MEKKLVNNLFNGGVKTNTKLFEKKIKPVKRLAKVKNINEWFDSFSDDKYDVIITGGIGDFVAIEPFLFKKYYNRIGNVILVTRGYKEITSLLTIAYPNLNIINIFPEFPNNFYAFITADDVLNYLHSTDYFSRGVLEFERSNNAVIDFSIFKVFNLIKSGRLEFNGSVFMDMEFTKLDKFKLPVNYISVVTTSNRDPVHKAMGRNLTELEIEMVVKYCDEIGMQGVCVYCNCVNQNKKLIHLEKITPIESLEVIKESKKYIGIDSWLSVIAGYKFDDLDIKIKCFNPHGLNNRDCYYPLVKTDNLFEPNFKKALFRHPEDLQKLS
jgi:hypothetical protein